MTRFIPDPQKHAAALIDGHGAELALTIAEMNASLGADGRSDYWRRVKVAVGARANAERAT